MHPNDSKIDPRSDYYVYVPGNLARRLYLYPLTAGESHYLPGYRISRSSFDSFLIMHISEGTCDISADGEVFHASAGQTVLLDCYRPHAYGNSGAWSAVWLHFDGILARTYFREITERSGIVLTMAAGPGQSCLDTSHLGTFRPDASRLVSPVYTALQDICNVFRQGLAVSEPDMSRRITAMLDSLLTSTSRTVQTGSLPSCSDTIADCIAYISDHYQEQISLDDMAQKAGFSPYHFTRIFACTTGLTPHQYLISTRIRAAAFLLKSTDLPVREIAFATVFSSESGFCTTYKKWEGMTPSRYRDPDSLD